MTRSQRIHAIGSLLLSCNSRVARLKELEGANNPEERLEVARKLRLRLEEAYKQASQIENRLMRAAASKGGSR
jgi:hypothetical protein